MPSARQEVTASAAEYGWQALNSPQLGEVIYRRDDLLVFCQYDRSGKLREATLRRLIAQGLTTVVAAVEWTDGVKVWHVTKWFTEYGRRAPARAARRRA